MPSPFDHVNHRAHDRGGSGGGRSMRDAMMDEAARFSSEVREAMSEERGRPTATRPLWKRLLRKR